MKLLAPLASLALLAGAEPAYAQIDLSRAGVEHLDNGLTVIVLEDHSLPVISVQALYKSGSRDETSGKTGLAHMLEHLAFRASENFPRGSATDAIYDAGGEWHGYTWIDQTTYFATAPADRLDLLLAIEEDRMARVTIDPAAMGAEAGAVITEMRGYQNDPSSVLFDAVAAAAITAHPYRNPTIGYESDVAALTAQDARDYYAAHYAPGNAVLVVAGDVSAGAALAQVRAHFAGLPTRAVAPRAAAVEPPQSGERRIDLTGPVDRQYLRLAYPAPSATSSDFAAFLLMQQLLSGGSGVNFRQNDWGTPTVDGSALAGAADDMASWFIPTADPYLLMLTASIGPGASREALEAAIAARISAFSAHEVSRPDLAAARSAVREALTFDLETPEDAAHQLAFFEGLGALDQLLDLDGALDAVTAPDVARVARLYLDPARRTAGWYGPGASSAPLTTADGTAQPSIDRPATPAPATRASAPQLYHLSSGLPVIVRPIGLSPTATVLLVSDGAGFVPGYGSAQASGLTGDLGELVRGAVSALPSTAPASQTQPSNDPATRLAQMLAGQGGRGSGDPVLAVVSGAVDPAQALALLETQLAGLPVSASPPAVASSGRASTPAMTTVAQRIPLPLAQAALGYTVAGPPPMSDAGLAMQMVLYVLTHEYGGRLGNAAIRDSGLVYYIDSSYTGDRASGQIQLATGVDPGKADAMEAVLRAEIARLATDPPSAAELAAARSHIVGSAASAAMDNAEIADQLARTYLASAALPDAAALERRLAAITPADIARAARGLATGTIMRVDVGPPPSGEAR